jgi:hypothetical protein
MTALLVLILTLQMSSTVEARMLLSKVTNNDQSEVSDRLIPHSLVCCRSADSDSDSDLLEGLVLLTSMTNFTWQTNLRTREWILLSGSRETH